MMRDRIFKTKGPLDPAKDQAILVDRREIWQVVRLAVQPSIYGYAALLGPRQTGKTTALFQIKAVLEKQNCAVAMVDLSPCENRDEADCYRFVCRQILADLGGQLKLPRAAREKLEEVTGPTLFRAFLLEVAQRARPPRLVIMLDEVKAIPTEIASAFFGTIRSVFSARRKESEQVLEKYLFVFAGAAELSELTNGKNSPLNICERIYLADFDLEQVRSLVANLERAGVEVPPEASTYIYEQTRGHPYLTQRLCSLLELREVPVLTPPAITEAVAEIVRSDDNLDHLTRSLTQEPAARDLARQIVLGRRHIPFTRLHPALSRLEMIGAITDHDPCAIRNPIYQRALERYLGLAPEVRGWRGALQRNRWTAVVAVLLLLTLPNLLGYMGQLLFMERQVNQAIVLPALNVTGYVRHASLIGVGGQADIEVEIMRPAGGDLSPVLIEFRPQAHDLSSTDGNYTLTFTRPHESQRFGVQLRKSTTPLEALFPILVREERRIDVFVTAAPPTSGPQNAPRVQASVPSYTVTMVVDYFSAFWGSALVWMASLASVLLSLISRVGNLGEWLSSLTDLLHLRKKDSAEHGHNP